MPLYLDEEATLYGTIEIVSSPLGREIQNISFGPFTEIARAPDPASGAEIGVVYTSEIVSVVDRNLQGIAGEISVLFEDFTGILRIQHSDIRPIGNEGWSNLFEQQFSGQNTPVTYPVPPGSKYLRVTYFVPSVGGTGRVLQATLTM
jgi:hypothetical protein